MGTKNNPGQFDCYTKAHPDEPLFVLRAKDPFGADMVSLWAALAVGDIYTAIAVFNALMQEARKNPHDMGYESSKFKEAVKCADAMRDWHEQRYSTPS